MMIWSYGVLITKRINNTNGFQINFHLGICLVIVGAILYPFANNGISPYRMCMSIIFFGLPIVIAQWFFVGSLAICKNHGVLTMMNFTAIGYTELVSYFRYDEKMNIIIILGIILVFGGVWQTIFNKNT